MLIGILTFIHVVVCLFLVIVVLIQSGKGADLAGAFGGQSQAAFGPRGAATWASRATTVAAVVFMITSLSLSVLQAHSASGSGSVLDSEKTSQKTTDTTKTPATDTKPADTKAADTKSADKKTTGPAPAAPKTDQKPTVPSTPKKQ